MICEHLIITIDSPSFISDSTGVIRAQLRMALEFVNVSPADMTRDRGTLRLAKEDRRRVRTQAMLDFRRKERQQPASKASGCKPRHHMQCPSPASHTIYSPEMWRSSFVQTMVAALFPSDVGYAHLLEDNVAYTCSKHKWAPVTAIHDALTLLHVGSTFQDEGLLLEGQKRYVFAIKELRQTLNQNQQKPQVSAEAVLVVAMAALMSEVLFPDYTSIASCRLRLPGPQRVARRHLRAVKSC